MLATLVDTKALLRIIIVGFGAGCGLVALYGITLLGVTRSRVAQGPQGGGSRVAYGALAAAGALACLALLVLGAWAMTRK